jgi:hypothetical protein
MGSRKQFFAIFAGVGTFCAVIAVSAWIALLVAGPSTEEVSRQQAARAVQSRQTRKELHDAEVWACKYLYGNLQRAMHARIMREIRGSRQVKQSYFNIPPPVYHRLIRASIREKRRELKRVAPVNCNAFWAFLAP